MWGAKGDLAGGEDFESLVTQIKELQRNNQSAKDQWIMYTNSHGQGNRDPNRHNAEFLQGFLTQLNEGSLDAAGNDAYPKDESAEGLVAHIKELQRNNINAKEQWIMYTDMHGQGNRDPNRHNVEFLQAFLAQFSSSGSVVAGPEPTILPDAVKMMQKRSPSFKTAWSSFCSQHGGGKNDPAKHDSAYHVKFFDHLAQQANSSMGVHPMMMSGENPSKRMRTSSGMGGYGGGYGGGGGMKASLVQQVKAFQKLGSEQKELWGTYCDTYLQGVRDPNRHDAATLHEFCVNHNVPEVDSMTTSMGGGAGWESAGKGGGKGTPNTSEKQALVDRIKAFQKAGSENSEVWGSFCGGTRDPNRHEISKLQEFCAMYDI